MKKVTDIKKLQLLSNSIRQDIVRMITKAQSGHPGGSLGMTDVFVNLYFNVMRHNPKKPRWNGRDYFILSNGHICPALYATLAHAGYFPKKELMTLRKFGSRLQGHPHRTALPGLETTSGPLGCGISQAAGMALALKIDRKRNRVFCMTSDGEHEEGNTWEGVMFAAKYKLDNLVCVLDRNYIQIDGRTEDIMPLNKLAAKYRAFNWHVIEIDGNDTKQILKAFTRAIAIKNKPTMIIAKNKPGKGVSFMENNYKWHGKAPTKEEEKQALAELELQREKLE